jgi:membrane associated rhomboid family serine protease
MLFLWIFGDNLEEELGHGGFALFYLVCGIGASLAQVLADPVSAVPTVGASGAIAGVMGGYLLLFPKAKVDVLFIFVIFFKIFPIPAWIMLGIWFGLQLVSGSTIDTSNGGVAYWAHAGGFIIGFLYMIPAWPPTPPRRQLCGRAQPHPRRAAAQIARRCGACIS